MDERDLLGGPGTSSPGASDLKRAGVAEQGALGRAFERFDAVRREVAASLSVVAGRVRDEALTVYSIMRNERYLLPAFLEYYRALGVEQFLILSDRSDDGTTELLMEQDDCVVLSSPFAYGTWIDMPPGEAVRRQRAGVLMKALIPRRFLHGSVGVYVDADEFLVLPSPMSELREVVRVLAERGADAVHASMIEMYPARFRELERAGPSPTTFEELLDVAPFFDGHPLVRVEPVDGTLTVVGASASTRLFQHYAIGRRRRILDPLPLTIRRRFTANQYTSAVRKTPVVHFRDGVDLTGSHRAAGAVYSPLLLGLLHFKFTPDSLQKVPRIITEKSHSRQSRKYVGYERLFEEMRRSDGSFLGPDSTRFEGARTLEAVGLVHA
jgi:hypothetical protein